MTHPYYTCREEDFPSLRALLGGDPNFPTAHQQMEEDLAWQRDFGMLRGHDVALHEVNPSEFARYLDRHHGLPYLVDHLLHYVKEKAAGKHF